jgi:hypothetical protein
MLVAILALHPVNGIVPSAASASPPWRRGAPVFAAPGPVRLDVGPVEDYPRVVAAVARRLGPPTCEYFGTGWCAQIDRAIRDIELLPGAY